MCKIIVIHSLHINRQVWQCIITLSVTYILKVENRMNMYRKVALSGYNNKLYLVYLRCDWQTVHTPGHADDVVRLLRIVELARCV